MNIKGSLAFEIKIECTPPHPSSAKILTTPVPRVHPVRLINEDLQTNKVTNLDGKSVCWL